MRFFGIVAGVAASVLADDATSMLQRSSGGTRKDSACSLKGTFLGADKPIVPSSDKFEVALSKMYKNRLPKLVRMVKKALTDSDDCWPADFGHYGPFFVRLAWHCSGTFRAKDGLGGCAGGRIRFSPEAEWADNANLDKARSLLVPIKDKFGDALSWGDLYILAGTLAIADMGGPTQNFCFGRIDNADGVKSQMLNCDPEWSATNQGEVCPKLLGATWTGGQDVSGLIYVNPQGPNGDPNPYLSAQDVERTFGRMGMSPSQTVALIGGGHAFGKAHASAGPDGLPTSGFEGQWTTTPTEWNNEYFKSLINENWDTHSTGGKIQWRTVDRDSEFADTMMLTADIALKAHPLFSKHAELFSEDQAALNVAFADAWWQLTTNGDNWLEHKQCIRLDDYE